METPPYGALTWPSSEVPAPNGITGTLCCAQMRTMAARPRSLRKHHRVRRLVLDPGQGIAMLLAHRLRGDEPVAERGGQRRRWRPATAFALRGCAASSATAITSCPVFRGRTLSEPRLCPQRPMGC